MISESISDSSFSVNEFGRIEEGILKESGTGVCGLISVRIFGKTEKQE